jgi:hypothetical protein
VTTREEFRRIFDGSFLRNVAFAVDSTVGDTVLPGSYLEGTAMTEHGPLTNDELQKARGIWQARLRQDPHLMSGYQEGRNRGRKWATSASQMGDSQADLEMLSTFNSGDMRVRQLLVRWGVLQDQRGENGELPPENVCEKQDGFVLGFWHSCMEVWLQVTREL